jgi:enamine deaminase RidA (YjgF/YER057c/UK114 family)
MSKICFSGITAYPIDVDPWSPGTYTLPADTAAQEKLLVENVDRMLKAAGVGWQNIVVLNRTGAGAPFSSMTERMGTWRPCRTTRAVTSGVPDAKVLCDITAVAPRRGQTLERCAVFETTKGTKASKDTNSRRD